MSSQKQKEKSSRSLHTRDAGKGGEDTPVEAANEPETFTIPPDAQLDDRDVGQYTGQGVPSQQKK